MSSITNITNMLNNSLGIRRRLLVLLSVVFSTLSILNCTSDAQRIRDSNEAARQSQESNLATATSLPASEVISIFDVRDGDCILDLEEGFDLELMTIVPCSNQGDGRVTSSFLIQGESRLPSVVDFDRMFLERCDRKANFFLFPTQDSWNEGDRTIICIQESFGHSENLNLLDNAVGNDTLQVGECFNEWPDFVELLPCSEQSEYLVTDVFNVDRVGPYPPEDYFSDEAVRICNPLFDWYYSPSPETWAIGDKEIICFSDR